MRLQREEETNPSIDVDLADILKSAVALAIKAGQKILAIYASDFNVNFKEDNSPLTEADLAAHRCLVEGLQALPGRFPLLSEESVAISYQERRHWDTFWLIDPLDGTKEFVRRNGEFTVNIALIHCHKPVLGVVYAPVSQTCYFSINGGGAYKMQGQAAPVPIAVRPQAAHPLVVASSRSHMTEDTLLYLSRVGGHVLKRVGSSLKFCLVAEGEADLYPRIGPTSEWDTAAAHCIVEAAGGAVTNLLGTPLLYNTKPSLLNPYFLVYGDTSRDWTAFANGIAG